ncbi:unnamed protein product [Mytilus edulis]|uniref:Uncharacterized protein n=1 Tax=Mytilus edulis TaxID=6550 RepID=A0A8S3SZ94_MYTED|nr:unnamed protein product [Mytilus edulis]
MEMYEAKIKSWEDSIPTNLDKIDHAKRQTETFLESMQNILLQEQTRLNESFQETVENIYLKSESKINSALESKIGEFEDKSESALELLQSSLVQDQTRFNETVTNMYTQSESKVKRVLNSVSSKMDEFRKFHKKGENAQELMQSSLMQDQARFNESFHETVKNMYIQLDSKVKDVLYSVSFKMDEFSKSHKNGENDLELVQSSLMQDQARFNESIHKTVKNMYIQLDSKVKDVLDSVSSKMDEFRKSHKDGENTLELMHSSSCKIRHDLTSPSTKL